MDKQQRAKYVLGLRNLAGLSQREISRLSKDPNQRVEYISPGGVSLMEQGQMSVRVDYMCWLEDLVGTNNREYVSVTRMPKELNERRMAKGLTWRQVILRGLDWGG